MPKFVIERNIAGAGNLSARELNDLSARSCRVLRDLGPGVQWMQSYVTDDRFYCIYLAPGSEAIREHALRGGFPVDGIREIKAIIDPTNGE